MSKKVYLILFIILCFKGWGVKIFPAMSSSTWLILQVLFLVYGFMHWTRLEHNTIGKGRMAAFWCIVLGIALSMIPASLYYGQGIMTSIVAYRRQILWLVIPVLLRVAPSKDDVVDATKFVTLVMWGVLLLRMFAPGYLNIDEERLEYYQDAGSYGYVSGLSLAVIPMYYSVERVLIKGIYDRRDILWIVVCYAFLFAMQNRSILFASSVVMLYILMRPQTRKNPLIILLAILVIVLFLFQTSNVWLALWDETKRNLSNEDYNRTLAYTYFLTEANTHFLQYVLGNGIISSYTSTLLESLKSAGVYNSDVGFIGFWNEFGLLPILAFIYMSVLAIFDKAVPSYVGMIGVTVLMCSPTTSYFGAISHSINFMLMYYLVCYYKYQSEEESESMEVVPNETI